MHLQLGDVVFSIATVLHQQRQQSDMLRTGVFLQDEKSKCKINRHSEGTIKHQGRDHEQQKLRSKKWLRRAKALVGNINLEQRHELLVHHSPGLHLLLGVLMCARTMLG
jgi:hypothetical protein